MSDNDETRDLRRPRAVKSKTRLRSPQGTRLEAGSCKKPRSGVGPLCGILTLELSPSQDGGRP